MKKLLLFLSFLVSYNLCLAQRKVIIKATQLSISSLAPMASFSIVGNNTGSPAVPVAISLGIGLTFDHGLLAVDTAHFKDTIFAVNGLQIIGASFNTIGLGGRLSQNTNISGALAWAMTIDSMQAASGRGFRVNFMTDAGWDLFTRDSATGYWTRIPKGTPGQVLSMLSTGGIGWGAGGGGASGWDAMLALLQQQTVDRKIRGGNHVINFDSIGLKFTNAPSPTTGAFLTFDPFPTTLHAVQTLLRIKTPSASNTLNYEMLVDNNANGGPPDDNIFINGWNPDSRTDPSQASFTERMESLFGATGWEYHLQWSNPGATRVYRFISYTFQDHGNAASDQNLIFMKNTGFEMRGLQNDNAHWSVSNSLNIGVSDVTTETISSNASTTQVRNVVDGTNNVVTEVAQAGNPQRFWQQFAWYDWQIHAGAGSGKHMRLDDLGGAHYTNLAITSDDGTTGALIGAINNSAFYTYIQSVGSTSAAFGIEVANSGNLYSNMPQGLNLMSVASSNAKILFGLGATPAEVARMANISGGSIFTLTATRFQTAKGANVASATNMTLGADGNLFHITGTTTINNIITTNWQAGSTIKLIFDGSVTVKNNTSGGGGTVMLLSGGIDFSATSNDVLVILYDGTSIFEQSRSVN